MKKDLIINRYGYIVKKSYLTENDIITVKKELTVRPFKPGTFGKLRRDVGFPLYQENDELLCIPKYYGLDRIGEPERNSLETYAYPTFDMQYLGKLRPRQEIIAANLMKGMEEKRGGLLVAACGIGKTNLAIYIACQLKLRTLFIVHKNFLKRQATDRILSTTNQKEVGVIQGKKKIDVDHPFVIGMVQSLSSIDYDEDIFKDFGLIIIDEVHHMAARNFSKVYQKISGKYMLGISAEKSRTDNTFKVINWYMGPILHEEAQKPNDMVVVKKYFYRSSNDYRTYTVINRYTQEPDRSTMITNLVHIRKRNLFMVKLVEKLFDDGKNILILSGRIKHVNLLYRYLNGIEDIKGNVGKYVGSMSEQELADSATKQIIIGSYAMAQEGLDIEGLNVVIFSTPISETKQPIGRILRKEFYETHPIVIDIIDANNPIYIKQSNRRTSYYQKQKYCIQSFKVSDYEKKNHSMFNDLNFIKESIEQPVKREIIEETKEPSKIEVVESE